MKIHILKCPNCGAELDVEDGLDICFCKYCGYKFILEGQSKESYYAKTKVKGMEHDERMADKKYEYKKYKIKSDREYEYKKMKLLFCLVVGGFLFFFLTFAGLKFYSNYQEWKLENLVEEIKMDIDNKKFDDAYIKAKSIVYTANWSDEIEEKWDNIRKEVINKIIEAEEKENGKSTHKRETDGMIDKFFSLFD